MNQRLTGKRVCYAQVSTDEQDLQLQLDALKKVGCNEDNIFSDKAYGVRSDRPGLDTCASTLQPGDKLVAWRLDRLGRSILHLVRLVEELLHKGIGFRSLSDGAIDTTTASGELMFNIFLQFSSVRAATYTRASTCRLCYCACSWP